MGERAGVLAWQCLDGTAEFSLRNPDFIKTLPVKAKFRSPAKKLARRNTVVPGDCAFPLQNFGGAIAGSVQLGARADFPSFRSSRAQCSQDELSRHARASAG